MSNTTIAEIDPVPATAGATAPVTASVNLASAAVRSRPPGISTGPLGWMRANLFRGWFSSAVTLLLGYFIVKWTVGIVEWALIRAHWVVPLDAAGRPDASICRAATDGACWAVIGDKYRFILFGLYPYEQQWRPAICIALFIGLYAVSANRRFWRKELLAVWVGVLALIGALMWGGFAGLPYVNQEQWGGLPITLILATFGLAFAFPLAVLVALGRRSTNLPAVKLLCVLYVELIRGVPLVSLLFMASVMFPLFMPVGLNPDKLLRAQVAIILFAGAYLAEVVRGGLQTLPKGQTEAADALGLSYWKKTGLIVLPQALRPGDPAAGQHLHRVLQGHLAGAHHRHLRPADLRQGGDDGPGLDRVLDGSLHRARRDLLRVLLRHVALQQRSRTRVRPHPQPLRGFQP